MKVIKIAHAAFNVADMDASISFYEKAFGFKKAFEMAHPATGKPWIVYLHAGNGQFMELFYGGVNPQQPYADANVGFSHICFEVEDAKAAEEHLAQAGLPVDKTTKMGPDGNYQCWTHDPDGTRIELMQMGENCLQYQFMKNL